MEHRRRTGRETPRDPPDRGEDDERVLVDFDRIARLFLVIGVLVAVATSGWCASRAICARGATHGGGMEPAGAR